MAVQLKGRGTLSEINVTPFVDVMLVLLVIFMVTAPLLQQGVSVELPRVRAAPVRAASDQLVVTIARGGEVFINRHRFTLAQLREKLAALLRNRPRKEVFLRADKEVPYGEVVKAMAAIRESGIQRLNMITEPLEPQGR